jgi:hypothetical protein|nr:MAG TPA_asm: hypothetical protein [Caudoviricetes sp.]
MNKITNAGCPHLTGVVCNAYEECEMGKACDLDCEWVELKRKEQECEAQRYKLNYYIEKTTQLLDDIDNYKQALDEIRQYRIAEINNEGEEENDTILSIIDEVENGK